MSVKILFFSVFLILILSGRFALAEGAPLTLDNTLSYVYRENPTILAARYNLRTTKEQYPQAAAGWKPRIDADTTVTAAKIDSKPSSDDDGTLSKSASISVEQPLFRGFRTVAEMDAAIKRIESDTANVRDTEQRIFVQTVEAYMNVIRDRQLLELQRQNVVLLTREKETVLARFEAGDVTQTDVKQTEGRYSSALADNAVAESQLQESEAQFEKITGIWPSDTFVFPVISFAFPERLDDLVAMAAMDNPQLSSSRSAHEAAEEDIRAAKSAFYPQVTAFASHIKEYDPQPGTLDESENSTIGIRARINLYEGGGNLSRVREAQSRANQRFVETIAAEKSVRSDIIGTWRRLQAYQAEIAARELEVAAAQYSAEGVREEARLGDRTVLDTLEADQEVLDAQSALVEARRDRVVAAYTLAAALGMLNPAKMGIEDTAIASAAE